jgi:Tfp pilus assembly protein PilO
MNMNMNISKKTRNLCITLAILIIVGLVGCFMFWRVIQDSIQKLYAAEVAAKEQQALYEQESTMKLLLDDVGPDVEKIKTRIVDVNGTVPFISQLEALAKDAGATMVISTVEVKKAETEGDGFEYLTMSITSQGSWNSIYRLITMIESLPYKVAISKVTLKQETYTGQGGESAAPTSGWSAGINMGVLKRK